MKVLLANPKFPLSFWGSQYTLDLLGTRASMPPLPLLTVAGLCPRDWDFRLRDLNVSELSDEDVLWADLVMVTGMAVQHGSMAEILSRCRRLGVTTVVGGPYVTESPEAVRAWADHLVCGEAETVLPRFIADFEQGTAKPVYSAEGEKPDVTKTPPPRFDLVDISGYVFAPLQFSRGCPFNCEFCDITALYGRRPRTKTAEQVLLPRLSEQLLALRRVPLTPHSCRRPTAERPLPFADPSLRQTP